MKIQITRVNTWNEDSVLPISVELLLESYPVYEGPGDEFTNSFVDGFICAMESLDKDYVFDVENIYE